MRSFYSKLSELLLELLIIEGNVRHSQGSIESFAEKLRDGLINPIVVVPEGDSYRVISGQRRVLAARHLGWSKIRAFVADSLDEAQQISLAVIDNVARERMSVPDIAEAIQRLQDLTGKPVAAICKQLGVSPSIASQAQSAMASLTDEARAVLEPAPMFMFFLISRLPPDQQAEVARTALTEQWTREQLQARVRTGKPKVTKLSIPAGSSYEEAAEALKEALARLATLAKANLPFKQAITSFR